MPVLRAIQTQVKEIDLTAISSITEVLPVVKSIEDSLDDSNAGIPDVARVIGDVLNFGSSDITKLRAAQLALEFRSIGAKKNDNRIIFNIQGNNVTLNNLVIQE